MIKRRTALAPATCHHVAATFAARKAPERKLLRYYTFRLFSPQHGLAFIPRLEVNQWLVDAFHKLFTVPLVIRGKNIPLVNRVCNYIFDRVVAVPVHSHLVCHVLDPRRALPDRESIKNILDDMPFVIINQYYGFIFLIPRVDVSKRGLPDIFPLHLCRPYPEIGSVGDDPAFIFGIYQDVCPDLEKHRVIRVD